VSGDILKSLATFKVTNLVTVLQHASPVKLGTSELFMEPLESQSDFVVGVRAAADTTATWLLEKSDSAVITAPVPTSAPLTDAPTIAGIVDNNRHVVCIRSFTTGQFIADDSDIDRLSDSAVLSDTGGHEFVVDSLTLITGGSQTYELRINEGGHCESVPLPVLDSW
jgi:hypothetical protein